MRAFVRTMTLWLWGGWLYYIIELLWRGYSHPSMFIVGGLCFLFIGGLNSFLPWSLGLVQQCVIGGIVVTLIEFLAGVILNIWLGLNIWDYSAVPMNIMGQVCVYFVFAWMALSLVGIYLDDYLRWKLYGEQKPKYTIL